MMKEKYFYELTVYLMNGDTYHVTADDEELELLVYQAERGLIVGQEIHKIVWTNCGYHKMVFFRPKC